MSFVCTKKLKLGETEFHPGDAIPDEAIAGGRSSKLLSYGYIAEVKPEGTMELTGVDVEPVGYITVTLAGKEVVLTGESVQIAADIMQKNVKEAAEAVADEVDESALAFVAACDSRKDVQKAVQKQLAVISSIKDDTNAPNGDSAATDGNE